MPKAPHAPNAVARMAGPGAVRPLKPNTEKAAGVDCHLHRQASGTRMTIKIINRFWALPPQPAATKRDRDRCRFFALMSGRNRSSCPIAGRTNTPPALHGAIPLDQRPIFNARGKSPPLVRPRYRARRARGQHWCAASHAEALPRCARQILQADDQGRLRHRSD